MPALITELIEDPDGHEVVTAAIGQLLAVEIANQQVLAIADNKNPTLWKAHVYVNRMKPFDAPVQGDMLPIINVWFNSANYDKDSTTVRAMRADGTWNVDVYGFGEAQKTTEGHTPGDLAAKTMADHWLGLVRKIIMSAQYTYLGSPRANEGPKEDRSLTNQFCYGRWVDSITTFQPELEARAVATVIGSRLALGVHYLVDSPQLIGTVFEILSSKVYREEDGRLLVAVETDISGSP